MLDKTGEGGVLSAANKTYPWQSVPVILAQMREAGQPLWDQLACEPARQYQRFMVYLALGPTRSLMGVCVQLGLRVEGDKRACPGNIKRDSTRYGWQERAQEYDRSLYARTQDATVGEGAGQSLEARMLKFHAGQWRMAELLQRLAISKMNAAVGIRVVVRDGVEVEEQLADYKLGSVREVKEALAMARTAMDIFTYLRDTGDLMRIVLQATMDDGTDGASTQAGF